MNGYVLIYFGIGLVLSIICAIINRIFTIIDDTETLAFFCTINIVTWILLIPMVILMFLILLIVDFFKWLGGGKR